ncbi:MAG: UrcA family protein [Parvularculaceae bacterium]|nr:UrcA family protein [Parvularculaceae bacterium]
MTKLMMMAAATVLSLTSIAHADDQVRMRLDRDVLTTQEGVESVYGALERQAKAACRDAGLAGRVREARRACQAALMDEFIEAIDHPKLAAFHGETIRLAG